MPDTHPEIAKLHAALGSILKQDATTAPTLQRMSPDEFLAYASDQVMKARGEDAPAATARLQHLYATASALTKSAFDGAGAMLPVYGGELSRQAQTAYSEQRADHTDKPGSAISFDNANTETNPPTNAFGRGSDVAKSIRELAEKHADAQAFKTALLGLLDGKNPEAATVGKADAPASVDWPRDLNADDVDANAEYRF